MVSLPQRLYIASHPSWSVFKKYFLT